LWTRIRIRSRFNGFPRSGSGSRRTKMTHKSRKKLINFIHFEVLDALLGLEESSVTVFDEKKI
jgi:hypothetical protein